MKLKRAFIIVSAAVLLLLFLYQIAVFLSIYKSSENSIMTISAALNLIGNTKLLCGICALTVMDFLFCLGGKHYSMKMFGIAVIHFSLFLQLELLSIASPWLYNAILSVFYSSSKQLDIYSVIAAYLIVNLLILATFILLTVFYIRAKHKFLNTQK